jgi:hypothetical protein
LTETHPAGLCWAIDFYALVADLPQLGSLKLNFTLVALYHQVISQSDGVLKNPATL